jgi:hypothetical protein
MPYSQDLLTQIVNVHWGGGGVFIAVNQDGNIYYLKPGGANPTWEDLGTLGFVQGTPDDFSGFPEACAFGLTSVMDGEGNVIGQQSVFVIVGGIGHSNSKGMIMASRDGKNWSKVFSFGADSETYRGSNTFGVVFNEDDQKFYAGGHQSDSSFDHESGITTNTQTDLLFSSPDGFTWSAAGSHAIIVSGNPPPPYPEYNTGLLAAHCSTRVVDDNGNGVPGGIYGYNEAQAILIAPTNVPTIGYLGGTAGLSLSTSVKVTISSDDDPAAYPPDPGIPTTCVANAGGEWVIAGGISDPAGGGQPPSGGGSSQAVILTTNDKGTSVWKRIDPPGTNLITCMCAGLLTEVPATIGRGTGRSARLQR